jgi:hypothetical protein
VLPAKTDRTNITITGDPAKGEGDIPAIRGMLYDPTAGQTEEDGRLGFLSEWQPNEQERAAIAGGALVQLRVYGAGHPPVSLGAGEQTDPTQACVHVAQIGRAIGVLYDRLAKVKVADDDVGDPVSAMSATTRDEFFAAFEAALDDVNQQTLEALREIREALDAQGGPQ